MDTLEALAARQKGGLKQRSIKSYPGSDEFMIKEIVIKGNRNYTDKYCIKKLGIRKKTRSLVARIL